MERVSAARKRGCHPVHFLFHTLLRLPLTSTHVSSDSDTDNSMLESTALPHNHFLYPQAVPTHCILTARAESPKSIFSLPMALIIAMMDWMVLL